MTWEEAEREIDRRVDIIVAEEMIKFYGTIVRRWAVKTGFSRRAWTTPQRLGKFEWKISNDVVYTPILWRGRLFVGDRWEGSTQMPSGGKPYVIMAEHNLRKRLRRLR